jgi:ketosteroid isomerase-like protein
MRRWGTTWVVGGAVALVTTAGLVAAAGNADRAARAEELRQAELAFAAAVAADDVERFAGFVAEDAVFVSGSTATRGREAIVESWGGFFGPDRALIEWHPELVELSGNGELGLTRGPWTLRGKDKEGRDFERSGVFNSVWRRQADGSWKVVFDAGCSPCPVCAPAPEG